MALPFVGAPLDEKVKKPGFKKLSAGMVGKRPLPASVNMLGKAAQVRGTPKPGIAAKLPHRVPRPMNPGRLRFPVQPRPGMGGPPAIQQNPLAALNIPGVAGGAMGMPPKSPLPLPGLQQAPGGY